MPQLHGELKVSMHERGYWHVAYSAQFHAEQEGDTGANRRALSWGRPKEVRAGLTVACRVITPAGAATTPIDEAKCKEVVWIDEPPPGRAIEVNVMLVAPTPPPFGGWTVCLGAGTKLIGRLDLDNGETAWVVWHESDTGTLALAESPARGRFYSGKARADLAMDWPRALMFDHDDNGALVLCDVGVRTAVQAGSG